VNTDIRLKIIETDTSNYKNAVKIAYPHEYRLISSDWQVNGVKLNVHTESLEFNRYQPGKFVVSNKSMLYCDTCLSPVVACNSIINRLKPIPGAVRKPTVKTETLAVKENKTAPTKTTVATGTTAVNNNTVAVNENTAVTFPDSNTVDYVEPFYELDTSSVVSSSSETFIPYQEIAALEDDTSATMTGINTEKDVNPVTINKPGEVDLIALRGVLSDDKLRSFGFDVKPILFDFDKSGLRWDSKKVLKNNVEILKKYNQLKVHLVGYTDSRGPDSYNLRLSIRRAKSVLRYLLAHGVTQSQVTLVEGRGATEFVNSCGKKQRCPESSHRMNRRVIFVVSMAN
jgi:outer membrane protein OmpA-like peptidoglycan-associated protein